MANRRTNASNWNAWLDEARDSFSGEILGLFLLLVGVVALFSLRSGDVAWLVRMIGWTAPWFALALIILGLVLMFRRRAGYWSIEALVGAELLLTCLTVLTFLFNHDSTPVMQPADGRDGGVVGWALGSLLLGGLGWWPAALIVVAGALFGAYLVVRYTPMIYLAAALARFWPALPAALAGMREATESHGESPDRGALAPAMDGMNFVPAAEEEVAFVAEQPGPAQLPPAPSAKKKKRKKSSGKASAPRPIRAPGELPPVDMLELDSGEYAGGDVTHMQTLIESTLEDFGVPVRVVHVETGPTVTQFGVEPLYLERAGQKRKVRVSRIVSLADDLALALAAPAVRIEAPVPGRPYVGLEVPNTDKTIVSMRGVLESDAMRKLGGALPLPLGRDTAGRPVAMDLAKAPHMLIAGQTGAGKSVCINTIISGLLMQHGPESLRFVLVDPKMVELPGYNGIPHVMGKVITDMDQVMGALTWLLIQMDDRYQLFRDVGVRNIDSYNALARRRKKMDPLPYMVLVVDELADLMMTAPEDIERQLCRLAQMARATGIHLILATQRPSTDVVTGLIKANFPTRIAFAVTSQIDSRVILDQPGAEKLLGRGDMLLMKSDAAKLFRVQGCWVSDMDIEAIVGYWKSAEFDHGPSQPPPWNSLMDRLDDEDELIHEAMDVIRELETCSASLLQRKLRIGYPKAARLIEDLEARGAIGPDLGGGQGRAVLLDRDGDEDADADDELDDDDYAG